MGRGDGDGGRWGGEGREGVEKEGGKVGREMVGGWWVGGVYLKTGGSVRGWVVL